MTEELLQLQSRIRDIPDFPKEGIMFKDITPLLTDGKSFQTAIDIFYDRYRHKKIDTVLGIESRGFIFASALAYRLGSGLTIVRKPGKLPYKTFSQQYGLEYGADELHIHQDAIKKDQHVLIVDDVLATGGTVEAVIKLVERMDGFVLECAFLTELGFLNGRDRLKGYDVFSVLSY